MTKQFISGLIVILFTSTVVVAQNKYNQDSIFNEPKNQGSVGIQSVPDIHSRCGIDKHKGRTYYLDA